MLKLIFLFSVTIAKLLIDNDFINELKNSNQIIHMTTNMNYLNEIVNGNYRKCTHFNVLPTCTKLTEAIWMDFDNIGTCIHFKSCPGKISHNCLHCETKNTTKLLGLANKFNCQKVLEDDELIFLENYESPYCKVGSVAYKQCANSEQKNEYVNWVSIMDKIFFIKDMKLTTYQDHKNILNYICGCDYEDCISGLCTGDKDFCSNFGCTSNSECICTFKKDSSTIYLIYQNIKYLIECWGSTKANVEIEVIKTLTEEKFNCKNCRLKCLSGKIIIDTHGLKINYIRTCLRGHCLINSPKDTTYEIILTREMMFSGGLVTLDVWFENIKESLLLETICDPVDVCSLITCTFCKEKWANFKCFDIIHWIIVTFVFIALLISIFISKVIFSLLAKIIIIIIITPLYKIFKKIFKEIKKRKGVVKTYLEDSDDEKLILPTISPDSSPNKITLKRNKVKYTSSKLLLLFAILFLPIVLSCSNTVYFKSVISDCLISRSGVESCSITNSIMLTVSPIGQTSCFIIQDPMKLPIGTFEIKTNSIDLLCKKKTLYWTYSPKIMCPSVHSCPWTSGCTEEICDQSNLNHPYGLLDSFKSKLSHSYCEKVPGCAANGCFACSSACLHYSKVLENENGEGYEVFTCDQWIYQLSLNVKLITKYENKIVDIKLIPGSVENALGLEVSLISVSVPPQPILNECFIMQKETISMIPCNKEGQFINGQIGEIQCPTLGDAEKATNNCKTKFNLIETSSQVYKMTCSSSLIDVNSIFHDHQLPIFKEGITILNQGSSIFAQINSIALFTLDLKTKNLNLISKTDNTLCHISFVDLKGCYSCSLGAKLSIIGNTDFGTAKALIKCEKNTSFVIDLGNKPEPFEIILRIDHSHINTNCRVICPAGETNFKLIGDLDFFLPKQYLINDTNVGTQLEDDSFISIPNVFSAFGWIRTLKLIGIIILILAISLTITYLIVNFINTIRKLKKEK